MNVECTDIQSNITVSLTSNLNEEHGVSLKQHALNMHIFVYLKTIKYAIQICNQCFF